MGKSTHFIASIAVLLGLAACSLEKDNFRPEQGKPELITITGEISQVYQTRANDSGFADKDQIGVYIVDYDGSSAGTLRNNGNRADNVRFTFDESAYKWVPDRDIYWKDKETHIDVYGYYPYSSKSVNILSKLKRIRVPRLLTANLAVTRLLTSCGERRRTLTLPTGLSCCLSLIGWPESGCRL